VKPGSVYLGVGPEQNYTYMVATRPMLAIIFDIRRGNLDTQLMYKGESSNWRRIARDFVSILFSKPRPAGLGASRRATDLLGIRLGRHEQGAVRQEPCPQSRTC
jgi:hypothetical protein